LKLIISRKIFYSVSLILGGFLGQLQGQETAPMFESIPPGLPNHSVRSIYRDSRGFIWFATSEGLTRFDGSNYRTYENDPGDPSSIDHNSINIIIEDNKKNLLVGTSAGLNIYNRALDKFSKIELPHQSRENRYVSSIYCDVEGNIWIGTFGNGLFIYNPSKNAFLNFLSNPEDTASISSDEVTRIEKDSRNNVWVGTRNGLNLFSPKHNRFTRFFHTTGSVPTCGNHITTLASDGKGSLWIGTRGNGLYKTIISNQSFVFKHYGQKQNDTASLSNNVVLSLCLTKEFLWIGTENGGLNRLRLSNDVLTRYMNEERNPYSLSGNSIWSLYEDWEGILWIGVYGKGVNVVNRKNRKFTIHQRSASRKSTLADNDVRAFVEDSDGKIWIATDGGGLSRFDPTTREYIQTINKTHGLRTDDLMSLLVDSKDNLWIGTWSGGVACRDNNGRITNYAIGGEPESGVIALYEDRLGHIWVGTSGSGLFRYDREADRFKRFAIKNHSNVPLSTSYVTSFLEDRDGALWVGTLYGLYAFTFHQDSSYTTKVYRNDGQTGSLTSNAIEFSFKDSKERLWFGTGDRGLNLLNSDGTFTSWQKKDGLAGNAVRGIVEDDNGNLWISTNRGLSRFNPETKEFKNFTEDDGLNSNEFYMGSCLRLRSGEIFMGGERGFNTFFADSVAHNPVVPPVYLTDLKVNGKSVEIGTGKSLLRKHICEIGAIKLSHEQTSFTISFTAVNYTHASRNQYAYRLDGFEKDWNYVDNEASATYTNIDPGSYTFMVKGSNNDGVWNEVPTVLSVIVEPPIWKTWWAILAYIVITTSVIIVFIKIQWERVKANNELKMERIAREKEHELSRLKMQFFTNISHEFRTPLSLIIAPLESLITSSDQKIRQQLMVTYRNACRLGRLVNDLMNFRKLDEGKLKLNVEEARIDEFIKTVGGSFRDATKSRGINFNIDFHGDDFTGWIDREKVETIITNILGNAFKFVHDNGSVRVKVAIENHFIDKMKSERILEIMITDDGFGISNDELPLIFESFYQAKSSRIKTSGTGIGLALVKGLVEVHHGSISARSIPDRETTFTVRLPIGKKDYQENELSIGSSSQEEFNFNDEPVTGNEYVHDVSKIEHAHILVVEDNDELRQYLAGELQKNFIVSQAKDGQEGIDIALSKLPDLIITDIVMPGKDGIELCRTLKSDIRVSHVPILLLTARTGVEEHIEGIDTGADAYLSKPFNIRLLFTQVRQLIDSRRKLYRAFSQNVYMMPGKLAENELDRTFLEQAVSYIVKHITDPQLNVETLADLFNMSRSQVYRKIKALTGKTAVEFVRIVRLKQALTLMESKKYTLAEIAYQTGFASPSYFSKSFREQYGKAPSEFMHESAGCQVQ
jgi:ligand-binding sensor domain-containing protein/signal transduction histidine kinase/DNA-binding response OmpR family regulator